MTNEKFIESIRQQGEEWKDIPSWNGFYIASTNGRIISLGRYVKNKNGIKWKEPKLLKQMKCSTTGYYMVALSKNNRAKRCTTHRLIAETFIPNPFDYPCVDHIDTNKTNNNVSNLRWCTYIDNMNNPITRKYLKSVNKPRSKHEKSFPVVALKNGNFLKEYSSISSVKEDGHDSKRVSIVCYGRGFLHHGLQWMFKEDYESLLSISKSKNA